MPKSKSKKVFIYEGLQNSLLVITYIQYLYIGNFATCKIHIKSLCEFHEKCCFHMNFISKSHKDDNTENSHEKWHHVK